MGSVYIAEQISTGKRRALKLMKPALVREPRLRERFTLEAHVGSRIESEHIVDVVGAGVEPNGAPWLAMELLDGAPLSRVVEQRGPLPFDEAKEIMRQLCHALGAAHAAGIVHRDLKPDNIFIAKARREGIPFTVKILDFGIAKLVEDAAATDSGTASLGTPLWMAPEQAERSAAIRPTADVWALGLIMFFVATGAPYWRAGWGDTSVAALMKEVLFEPIIPASMRAAELQRAHLLPAGFDAWFALCVQRDPNARYVAASVARDAFLTMTSGAASNPSLDATLALPPQSPAVTPVKPTASSSRASWLAIPLVVVVLAVIAGLGMLTRHLLIHKLKTATASDIAKFNEEDAKAEARVDERMRTILPLSLPVQAFEPQLEAIPLSKEQPFWGVDKPLLNIVVFCNFKDDACASAARELAPDLVKRTRFEWRHMVRSSDLDARLAAEASQGVYESEGSVAFQKFRDLAFAHRGELTRKNVIQWARDAGVQDTEAFAKKLAAGTWSKKVDDDTALGVRLRLSSGEAYANCMLLELGHGELSSFHVGGAYVSARELFLGESDVTFDQPKDVYLNACKQSVRNVGGFVARGDLSPALRSPYASPRSTETAREVVSVWNRSLSEGDGASLESTFGGDVTLDGKHVTAKGAAAAVLASAKGKRSALLDMPEMERLDETTVRAHVARVEGDAKSRRVVVSALTLNWADGWHITGVQPDVHEPTCRQSLAAVVTSMPDVFDLVTTPIPATERQAGHVANVVHAEPNGGDELYMLRPEQDWGSRYESLHNGKITKDIFFSILINEGKPTVLDGPQPTYDEALAKKAVRTCAPR